MATALLDRCLDSVPAFVRQKLDGIRSIERLGKILDRAPTVRANDELVFDRES